MFTIAFFTTCRSFLSTFLVLPICYSRDMIEIFPSIFEINYNDTIDFKVERFVKEIKSANILNHLFPVHPFSTLRFSDVFRWERKDALRINGLKLKIIPCSNEILHSLESQYYHLDGINKNQQNRTLFRNLFSWKFWDILT